jgi:hypothetical protein
VDAAIRAAASRAVAGVHGSESERCHDACREGSLGGSHGPSATIARGVHNSEPTGGAGLPGAGGRDGAAGSCEARGNHRSQRPASNGFGGAHTELHTLGVRTVMVTGDASATAAIVTHAVALDGAVCPPGPIPNDVRVTVKRTQ